MASATMGQAWTESGDARSFPDGAAQVTRGEGLLGTIVGATELATGDLRDAYCIKIVDPGRFLATTDPATAGPAGADFATRLFLFRPDGAPVLANDDTPPGGPPYLSTLTGVATDGSGFTLTRPGEYVLIVAGFAQLPQDDGLSDLFLLSPSYVVAAANPAAGAFEGWDLHEPATGSYTVALEGVEPCQGEVDAVVANYVTTNRVCLGDGSGALDCAEVGPDDDPSVDAALGFVNDDSYLDVVFSNSGARDRVCLGDGRGRFSSCSDATDNFVSSYGVALGFIDGDETLDALFLHDIFGSRVCLGDGSGGFSCAPLGDVGEHTDSVALGFIDGDTHLDAVFGNGLLTRDKVCLGDGDGGFACSDLSDDTQATSSVALGDVDEDGDLDAVFSRAVANRTCLGDGQGGFSCFELSGTESAYDVALGFVDGDDHLDAVFARNGVNSICLGDGSGDFPSCSDVSADSERSLAVSLALVDGDDHLDAVFANSEAASHACLGDGEGGFTFCRNVWGGGSATAVALGELGTRALFEDGFESGDTSAWSAVLP